MCVWTARRGDAGRLVLQYYYSSFSRSLKGLETLHNQTHTHTHTHTHTALLYVTLFLEAKVSRLLSPSSLSSRSGGMNYLSVFVCLCALLCVCVCVPVCLISCSLF